MKVIIKILTFLFALAIVPFNLFADKNDAQKVYNTKLAAISQVLREQKIPHEDGSVIKLLRFNNSVADLLKLDAAFADPQQLEHFLEHFEFTINDQVIPVHKSITLAIRQDKPFTVGIKAKRGKLESLFGFIKSPSVYAKELESLLAVIKTSAQSVYKKAANFFTFSVKFNVPLHKDIIDNNVISLDEVVFKHRVMREILKNPSNIINTIKDYLTWSEWFGLEAKLPDLEYQEL